MPKFITVTNAKTKRRDRINVDKIEMYMAIEKGETPCEDTGSGVALTNTMIYVTETVEQLDKKLGK